MRILVVEDDPMLPNSLKLGLGQQILLADMDFHSFIYHLSGNPLIAGTVRLHRRHFSRAMEEVLHHPGMSLSVSQEQGRMSGQ